MKIKFLSLILLSAINSKNYTGDYGSEHLEIKREAELIQATHFVQSQGISSELVVTKRVTDKEFISAWLYYWNQDGHIISRTCLSLDCPTTPLISILKEKINEYEASGHTHKQIQSYESPIIKSQACSIL